MQRKQLTGTLEEQCEFLYELAQRKMAEGNFTGAAHALKEIVKHVPDYRDAAVLLQEAQQHKAEQRRLLLSALVGAMLFIGIGTLLQLPSDLLFLLLAVVGALVGYALAAWFNRRHQQPG
jgi:hypothetical protein